MHAYVYIFRKSFLCLFFSFFSKTWSTNLALRMQPRFLEKSSSYVLIYARPYGITRQRWLVVEIAYYKPTQVKASVPWSVSSTVTRQGKRSRGHVLLYQPPLGTSPLTLRGSDPGVCVYVCATTVRTILLEWRLTCFGKELIILLLQILSSDHNDNNNNNLESPPVIYVRVRDYTSYIYPIYKNYSPWYTHIYIYIYICQGE